MFKKKNNNRSVQESKLQVTVLFESVIAGPVNCTYAFNYWTVTGAAHKHAARQLVTVL